LCLPLLTLVLFRISEEEYIKAIKEEIRKVVELQEELDIDVLVHGEPEVSLHHLSMVFF
jgi:methionine synthase II (cobalamin-independent)